MSGPASGSRPRIESHAPSVRGGLSVLAAGTLGIPLAIAIDRSSLLDLSWLVALPMAALAWGLYALVWRDEEWRLVAVAADGTRRVLGVGGRAAMEALLERNSGLAAPDGAQTPQLRLVFLDLVRSLAVVLMIFAHFSDQLLDTTQRATPFAQLYNLSRGFTAPLFFVVSGWSFAVAVLPRFGAGGLLAIDLGRRLRRAAALLLWGYAVVLPWWAPGFPFDAAADVWTPFWTAGVLGCLGATLLGTLLLMALLRRPWPFLAACALVAILAILLEPGVTARVAGWPVPLRGFFDRQSVPGGFPLTPWAGYFLAGVVLGGSLTLTGARATTRILLLLGVSAGAALGQSFAGGPHLALVLLRLAVTAAALGFAALFAARSTSSPRPLRYLSRYALTFYVTHMFFLWGVPFCFGLAARVPGQLSWAECGLLTAASVAATSALIHFAACADRALADWLERQRRVAERTPA